MGVIPSISPKFFARVDFPPPLFPIIAVRLPFLKESGIGEIFTPGTPTSVTIDFIKENYPNTILEASGSPFEYPLPFWIATAPPPG